MSYSELEVYVGHSIKRRGRRYLAERIHRVQSDGDQFCFAQDVGLIKTRERIRFGSTAAPAILWPNKDVDDKWPIQEATFGQIQVNHHTDIMQGVKALRQLNYNECKTRVVRGHPRKARCFVGPEWLMCTYTPGIAHRHGDSGAGLVVQRGNKNYVTAVVSGGGLTIARGGPLVDFHAKVYPHLNWIKRLTGIAPRMI